MSLPVAGTGRSRWHRRRSAGVIANSRELEHRYPDEGDKGPWIRRLARRRKERRWVREAREDVIVTAWISEGDSVRILRQPSHMPDRPTRDPLPLGKTFTVQGSPDQKWAIVTAGRRWVAILRSNEGTSWERVPS